MTEEEFDKAIAEACRLKVEEELRELDEEMKDFHYEPSDRFKRKMNRLFREQVGSKNVPHPEVDTPYEKFRSFWVRRFLLLQDKIKKLKIFA